MRVYREHIGNLLAEVATRRLRMKSGRNAAMSWRSVQDSPVDM
jgi:hypothetical protein